MRQRVGMMLLVAGFILPWTGCGVTILTSDEVVYDAPDRPGYKEISEGALAKLIKCCEACLDKQGAKP